jgi:hypothetical protein
MPRSRYDGYGKDAASHWEFANWNWDENRVAIANRQ